MKNILITGITGQDGVFLSKLIAEKEPESKIYGISRNKVNKKFFNHLASIETPQEINLRIVNLDLNNYEVVDNLISDLNPSVLYNLSGPSSVNQSVINPKIAYEITNIFNNLTNSLINNNNFCRFFQASSSEIFANSKNHLSENSNFYPNSPYAKAKLDNHNKAEQLSLKFEWPIFSGILFNHESQFRDKEFLLAKIIDAAIEIKRKNADFLEVGSLSLKRDWSYAKDTVDCIYRITNEGSSFSYNIGSGKSTSIEELIRIIFSHYELEWKKFVRINKSLLRDGDPIERVADITKVKNEFGWSAQTSINELIELIIKSKTN